MASFMNAGDVVASAVEIEKRGHEFYKKAAAGASKAEVKEFFAFMAGEEEKHEKIFKAMLSRLGGLDLPTGAESAEYLDYVQASLDSHLLFTGEVPDKIGDPFPLALRFEKDTIFYFTAMLDMVPESEKKYVKDCIDEEKKHILLLSKKRQVFKG